MIAWRSVEARTGGRRLWPGVAGRARLPTLSRPRNPPASRSAVTGYRMSPPGAGTLAFARGEEACSGRMPVPIPTTAVLLRFPGALRPAGIPLCPVECQFATLKSERRDPAPQKPTHRARLAFRPRQEPWPATSRENAPARNPGTAGEPPRPAFRCTPAAFGA
jgi:hypothetical protein